MFTFALDVSTWLLLCKKSCPFHLDCFDWQLMRWRDEAWLLLCKKSCRFHLDCFDWQFMCRRGEAEKFTTAPRVIFRTFLTWFKEERINVNASETLSLCMRIYSITGFRRMSGGKPPWTPGIETWWFILVNWFRLYFSTSGFFLN